MGDLAILIDEQQVNQRFIRAAILAARRDAMPLEMDAPGGSVGGAAGAEGVK